MPNSKVNTAPPKQPRLTGDQRRGRFLDVAGEIIRDSGVEAVTMERVAERSGVNKALGYRYFANRDNLLIALDDRESERLDQATAAALARCTTFDERLRAIVHVYFDSAADDGLAIAFALRRAGATNEALRAHQQARVVGIVVYFAQLLVDDLGLRPPEAIEAAAMLSAGIDGLVELWRHTKAPRRRVESNCVTMCLGALESLRDQPERSNVPRKGPAGGRRSSTP